MLRLEAHAIFLLDGRRTASNGVIVVLHVRLSLGLLLGLTTTALALGPSAAGRRLADLAWRRGGRRSVASSSFLGGGV